MKQAQIQRLRSLVALELTSLHEYKVFLKKLISEDWIYSSPDTEDGREHFMFLNINKNKLRTVTKRIAKLSQLIKDLKKEEKLNNNS